MTQNISPSPTPTPPVNASTPPEAYQALTETALRDSAMDSPIGKRSPLNNWNGYVEDDPIIMKELAEAGYRKMLAQSDPNMSWHELQSALEKRGLGKDRAHDIQDIGSAAVKAGISAGIR